MLGTKVLSIGDNGLERTYRQVPWSEVTEPRSFSDASPAHDAIIPASVTKRCSIRKCNYGDGIQFSTYCYVRWINGKTVLRSTVFRLDLGTVRSQFLRQTLVMVSFRQLVGCGVRNVERPGTGTFLERFCC